MNSYRLLTKIVLIGSLALAMNVGAQVSCPKSILFSQALSLHGVESFGMQTRGGSDGKLLKVTNLKASGEGSLKWALQHKGARLVVFEVGGVIDLGGETVWITEPYLTVAGETAPSPGVTLIRGGLSVRAHDVKISHVRIRPGDNNEPKRSGWETDGIAVSGESATRVHIDHVSVSWAIDENLSASGPRQKGPGKSASNVTFSNSIIAEALDYATHKKGRHSKGLLVHDYVTQVAVIGNLFISNDRRNPYFKSHATGVVVNNLIYNAANRAIHLDYIPDEWVDTAFKPGNASIAAVSNILRYGRDTYSDLAVVSGKGNVFMCDNQTINLVGDPMPQSTSAISPLSQPPLWPKNLSPMKSKKLEAWLLKNVGARPWDRDAIDLRILKSYTERTSRMIDSQEEVGGYPKYPQTRRELNVPDENIDAWLESFRR